MTVEILACPFESCSPEHVEIRIQKYPMPEKLKYKSYAECENCGARGPLSFTTTEEDAKDCAVYSWNLRL